MTSRLDTAAWPEVAAVAATRLLVIPLGSTEQHGPHLPFSTDSDIAIALADALARSRGDIVVAPVLPYGSSGEHAGFVGTLSLGASVFEHAVVELVRSADGFAGVVLVSAHGGNADALAAAARTLEHEGRRVLVWSPSIPGGDAHAGRTETSMMLALRRDAVCLDRAARGDTRPLHTMLADLRAGGVATVSANGVLGDPAGASAEEGLTLLATLAGDLIEAVRRWLR